MSVLIAAAAAFLIATAWALRRARRDNPAYIPVAAVLVSIMLHFCVAPIYTNSGLTSIAMFAVLALGLGVLGLGALSGTKLASFFLPRRGRPVEADENPPPGFSNWTGWVALGLAPVLLYNVLVGGSGYDLNERATNSSLLSNLSELYTVSLLAVIAMERKFSRLTSFLLALQFFAVLASGFRGVILSLGIFAVLWVRGGKARGMAPLRRFVAVMVLALVPLSFYGSVEDARRNVSYNRGDFSARDALTNPTLPDTEVVRKAADRADLSLALNTALLGDSPTLRNRGLSTYVTAPFMTAFIPRQLVPDKPGYDDGRILSYELFGQDRATKSASTVTWFGEAYLVRGWIGVVAVLGVIGATLGLALGLVRRFAPELTIAAYGVLSYAALDIEHSVITLTASVMRQFGYLILLLLAFKALRSRREAGFVPQPRVATSATRYPQGEAGSRSWAEPRRGGTSR